MPELDKELAQELIDLAAKYEQESEEQYRAVVRRVSQTRAMVKGEYCPGEWWDGVRGEWRQPEESEDFDKESAPRFNYHINYMQAWWQILQGAIQTVGIPGVTFRPQNSAQPEDREAAKMGKEITDYERTLIDFRDLLLGIYRLFFTDGLVLAYTRYVKDGARFGTSIVSRSITEPRVTRAAGYECFGCNEGGEPPTFTPAGMTARDETGAISCPDCGTPFHQENFVPEKKENVVVGQKDEEVANGREVTDLYGALETFLPWWANDLDHAQYCKIVTDVSREEVIAAFADDKARAERIEKEVLGQGSTSGKTG